MTAKFKGSLKSRLMWAAFAFAVLNAAMIGLPALQPYLKPVVYAVVNFIFALVVAGLRWVTTQPLEAFASNDDSGDA